MAGCLRSPDADVEEVLRVHECRRRPELRALGALPGSRPRNRRSVVGGAGCNLCRQRVKGVVARSLVWALPGGAGAAPVTERRAAGSACRRGDCVTELAGRIW